MMFSSDMLSEMMGGGMFGGGMMGGMRSGPRRGRDVGVRMACTLEELYVGAHKEFEFEKQDLCGKCSGTGSKSRKPTHCTECRGRGVVLIRRAMGPIIQQMQAPCSACGGAGKTLQEHDRCRTCNGEGAVETKKRYVVEIEPGMQDEQHITLEREAGRTPEIDIPGDLVFVLNLQEHESYQVRGADLIMQREVTLCEALTGFKFEHTHLDGRKLMISAPSGAVLSPGKKMMISEEGMPTPHGNGDLIIQFSIAFPRILDDDQVHVLAKALPGPRRPSNPAADDAQEEVFMEDYSPEQWAMAGGVGEEEEDDAADDGGGGIRCAHQ